MFPFTAVVLSESTDSNSEPNDYVRITVSYVFSYLVSKQVFPNCLVVILADNDYYTQAPFANYEYLRALPRFNSLAKPISEIPKTGLGSSAALITALTAALLKFYTDIDITSEDGKRIVHNLAQAAHCAAQGKVGSGFDIAAAVYGSSVYRRFDPKILESVLLDSKAAKEFNVQQRYRLAQTVGMVWQMDVNEFQLPPGLRVVMGDVAAGSSTPSMVRSVLKWKSTGSGAQDVWNALGAANRTIIDRLNDLRQFTVDEIIDELREGMHIVRHTSRPRVYQALCKVTEEFEVPHPNFWDLRIRKFVRIFVAWERSHRFRLSQIVNETCLKRP
jgi:phosphomevalonate kinase